MKIYGLRHDHTRIVLGHHGDDLRLHRLRHSMIATIELSVVSDAPLLSRNHQGHHSNAGQRTHEPP
ncbi:hypothetical protein [Actinokineospora fastidiosa]|uniref:hypothetical protein n=1 Tax=Actinokineospora fastidiosa TaxID=1816 RepID=UPI0016703DF4|nr:hypothetical protein [Actinokineospora fastidiosa]